MTDSPQIVERLSAVEAKTGQVLDEVSYLRKAFSELEKFIGNHTADIERMKVELGFIKVIGMWIFAPLLGTLGVGAVLAIFYAINK